VIELEKNLRCDKHIGTLEVVFWQKLLKRFTFGFIARYITEVQPDMTPGTGKGREGYK
jgi:hypothetical protein